MATAYMGPFPIRNHRTLAQVAQDEIPLSFDFSDEERAVICERRQHQSATELAAVFGTTRAVIGAIVREGRR